MRRCPRPRCASSRWSRCSLARLGTVLLDHDAAALLIITNGSALVFGALLYRLALRETGDEGAARAGQRWYGAILPPAVALVLGYAEATFMLLSVAVFLLVREPAVRRGRSPSRSWPG